MLYRLLETEISLSDKHRRSDLISTVRTEMDRLLAQSPMIPQKIVDYYNAEFPDTTNKPDICNGMVGEHHFNTNNQPPSPSLKSRINNMLVGMTRVPDTDAEVEKVLQELVSSATHPHSSLGNTGGSLPANRGDTQV